MDGADGNNLSLYLNGKLLAAQDISQAQSGQDTNLCPIKSQIGFTSDTTRISKAFNGRLDDIRVYNRALSANEIESLYRATR